MIHKVPSEEVARLETLEGISVLKRVDEDADLDESLSYKRRILMYKGPSKPEELMRFLGAEFPDLEIATQGYGLSNYYYVNGDLDKSNAVLKQILTIKIANDVMVMCAGEAVEHGGVHGLYKHPLHPYTEGLLRSVSVMEPRVNALYSIPGTLPGPKNYPAGCRFSPHCSHCTDRCRTGHPPLYELPDGRRARCFLREEGGKRLD